MKTKLFALATLAVLAVQSIMAIPKESFFNYYYNNVYSHNAIASYDRTDLQSETVFIDPSGLLFGANDTILYINRVGNSSQPLVIANLPETILQYKNSITAIVIRSESNHIQIMSKGFQNFKKLETVYAYVDTVYFGGGAFSSCRRLATFEASDGRFPKSRGIENGAFAGCAFTSIDLSNSDSIAFGSGAFSSCESLKSFVFPPKAGTSFPKEGLNDMFFSCKALDSIVWPNYMDVRSSERMFFRCTSLKELNVPDGFWCLEENFLFGCTGLEKLSVPSSVRWYDKNLLNDCKALDTVYFAGQTLQAHTFDSCPDLHSLTLGYGVDSIADYAFSGLHNISVINLPGSLRAMTGGAFLGATGIDEVSSNCFNGFCVFYGFVYKGYFDELVYAPQAQTPSMLTFDDRLKRIGKYAFCNNTRADTILFHYDVEYIGDSAFAGCTNIRKLYIPNMQTTVGQHAFDGVQEVVWSNKNYPNACANQDLVWSIDSMGLFTMEGQGDILYQSWKPYNGSIHNIIWPRGVTIPDNCMEDCYEIQCAILPIKEQDLPNMAFSHSEVHVYDDAVGSVYGGIPLLQPVNVELEDNMEIIPMYDSLLVRWKAPGPEPENTYAYTFFGEGLLYTPHTTAFSSEAFHNRAIEYIKTGQDIYMLMEWLSSGQYPCYEGEGEISEEYKPNVYEMVVPLHEDGIHRYTMLTGCGGNEVRYTLDSISTTNTMPQNMLLTKDESRLDDGIVNLTFQWDWLPWKSSTAELQLIENNTVIRSAFVAPINDKPTKEAEHLTHTEQLTAEQLGYGQHTLTWRARSVENTRHSNVLSSWAQGEEIQFTFIDPQGIEDIHTDAAQPTKILLDGQLYILRGDDIYTLQGQKLR